MILIKIVFFNFIIFFITFLICSSLNNQCIRQHYKNQQKIYKFSLEKIRPIINIHPTKLLNYQKYKSINFLTSNMNKSQQPSSFMDQDNESQTEVKIQKQQNQFKALFLKNTLLQSKQKCTNICQIITPIICLIFTFLIKTIAQDGLKVNVQFDDNQYPFKFDDFSDYDKFNTNNSLPVRKNPLTYYVYQCANQTNCNSTFLGQNDGISQRNGMLGNIPATQNKVTFYPDPYNKVNATQQRDVPFFLKVDSINKVLSNRLEVIGVQNFSFFKQKGKDYLPDGAVKFNSLNDSFMDADIKVNDCRDLQYHRYNGISKNQWVRHIHGLGPNYVSISQQFTQAYGLLNIMHSVASAFIQQAKDVTVSAGYLLMPAQANGFVDTLINSISALIYPLGLSLLFPVFLYTIVLEKQERLVQMMKMNGLKIRYYWLTFFVFNLILCIITNLIFYLLGYLVLDSAFFVKTSKTLIFFVSLGWSLSQIGMAAFFQTFLNKSRSANIIGYLFSIWTTMIGATLNLGSYQYPAQLPIGLRIIPPFAFVRSYYLMMMGCSAGDCVYDIGLLTEELKSCIIFLYLGFVVFFLLGVYLFEVLPQQFGVRRNPLFPFYSFVKLFKKKNTIQINTSQDLHLREYISDHEQDQFSKKQRQRVIKFCSEQDQEKIKNQYPLIINNMRKLYNKKGIDGMYPAVRSFNLAIEKKETFGLLGPNGAGKTTLISMITGMYEPNNGNAWIGGYDIQTSIQKAQLQMGVCPQFDLVWPQLSVSQHLYFYARLKGIPQKLIKNQVEQSLKEVKLQKFGHFAASQLSGGMRRRLSVAISLVGDPRIVFLDQPSTGLDPQNRRQLWAVLAECQTKRALLITTHMMQEADTLCNRVGIITSGVLRTVQTPMKLKKTYGEGYDVIINTLKEERQLISQQSLHLGIEEQRWLNQQAKVRSSIGSFIEGQMNKANHLNEVSRKIVQFMKKEFPGTYLSKHFNGYLIFKVPSTFKISTLFETMNLVEKELGFSDVAITNSSLEDVFMKVVQIYDSDEKRYYPYNSKDIQQKKSKKSIHELKQQIQEGAYNQLDKNNQNHQEKSLKNNHQSLQSQEKFQSIDPNKKLSKNQQNFESIISKKRDSVLSQHSSPANQQQKIEENKDSEHEQQNNQNNNQKNRKSRDSSDYY